MKKYAISILLACFSFSTFADANDENELAHDFTAKIMSDVNSIELKWTPPIAEGEVILARSSSQIDSAEKLYNSDSLGRYPNTTKNPFNSFKDLNLKPGTYYYAIIMVQQVKKRVPKLVAGVNYTINPIEIMATQGTISNNKSDGKEKEDPNFIQDLAIGHDGEEVHLHWAHPSDSDERSIVYTVYRSKEPLNTIAHIKKAERIGEVSYPENTFTDKTLDKSQTIYYGVSVSAKGEEFLPLKDKVSYTRIFFIRAKKPDSQVADKSKRDEKAEEVKQEEIKKEETSKEIAQKEEKPAPLPSAPDSVPTDNSKKSENACTIDGSVKSERVTGIVYEKRKNGIFLAWTPPKTAINNSTIYFIYESKFPMKGELNSLLTGKAKKIAMVAHPETTYLVSDAKLDSKKFYGVTVRTPGEDENFSLYENESYVMVKPLKEKKKSDTVSKKKEVVPASEESESVLEDSNESFSSDFQNIMTDYYKPGKYSAAISEFSAFLKKEKDRHLRAKAMFYMALSFYHKKDYDSALAYLRKNEVTAYYDKDRVDFYIKRCLEN